MILVKSKVLLLLLFIAFQVHAQQISRIGMSEVSLKDYVDSIATKSMSDYEIPGLAIGIVQGDYRE